MCAPSDRVHSRAIRRTTPRTGGICRLSADAGSAGYAVPRSLARKGAFQRFPCAPARPLRQAPCTCRRGAQPRFHTSRRNPRAPAGACHRPGCRLHAGTPQGTPPRYVTAQAFARSQVVVRIGGVRSRTPAPAPPRGRGLLVRVGGRQPGRVAPCGSRIARSTDLPRLLPPRVAHAPRTPPDVSGRPERRPPIVPRALAAAPVVAPIRSGGARSRVSPCRCGSALLMPRTS
jgi:hypothetical protein